MSYPGFIQRWAQRRLARMLPRQEAALEDAEAELARLKRFEASFGGRARRIVDQEKTVERKRQRVERAKAALLAETDSGGLA